MPVELHLPDLPEVPISLGAAPGPRPRRPWHMRLRDMLSSYLPLLMMTALALATWWLVKNTPTAPPERTTAVDAGAADYTMRRFNVQRFAADGRLRLHLEGTEMRHFPVGDRIEIDEVRLRAFAPDGRVTTAQARRAVSNGEASEITLEGGAEVLGTDADGRPVEIRSEYLHADLETEVVGTDRPVQVLHGTSRLSAGGLSYDARRRVLDFRGPVRALLQTPR
jgi:lipopolysaccharide export system protein LptC